jgi:hypothetical protein
LTGGRQLNIFLGGRATLLILCLASILHTYPPMKMEQTECWHI